jgi:tripartite-type tricarboxylate transporter receptor subunit TctC
MIVAACTAISIQAAAVQAIAQPAYPLHAVTIVVPASAGSGPDISARRIAALLSASLGQPVIVDNRAGAAGITGTDYAAHSKADGYTLYVATNAALCINPALYSKLPYDPARSFVPITMMTQGHPLLLIDPRLPIRSLKEFVAYAKQHPGELNFASSGNGSTSHLAGELLKSVATVELTHVAYKEESRAITDVIGGQVQATIVFGAVAVEHVKAGRLRALAVAGPNRNPLLPDVPTAAEQGFPGFEVPGWIGLMAISGTPPEILEKLGKEARAAVRNPQYVDWVSGLGSHAMGNSTEEFSAQIRTDTQRWSAVVKAAGVHLD